jgi:hypothetical protein
VLSRFSASRRDCILFSIAVALASAVVVLARVRADLTVGSDIDQVWGAARALLAGENPYAAVGPTGHYRWVFPLYYPLPAAIVMLPFAWLPVLAARTCFVALSCGLLAYGVARRSPQHWPLFLSGSFLMAVTAAQWSPLLTAALLLPWLGWTFAAKPTIGAALWVARPRLAPVIGCAVLVAATLVVRPSWPLEWLTALAAGPHFRAPVQHVGGVLVLLALTRWRRPEARLLAALACIPQTTVAYEALPLFLVPQRRSEGLTLAVLSQVVFAAQRVVQATLTAPGFPMTWLDAFTATVDITGDLMVALLYLPCLIMVLRRPNEGAVPAWAERVAEALGGWSQRLRPRSLQRAV